MTTSGTWNFAPSLGEVVLYAYNLIGIRSASLVQEHMTTARMAANLLQSRWSNQGVNLWAVDLQNVPLVAGQATYNVPANTMVMLDAYISTENSSDCCCSTDRIILPISRSEYANYPEKCQEGFPTTFWFDRLLCPKVTLWPVPDGTQTYLRYYRVRMLQDANLAATATTGNGLEIPNRWYEAYADGMAYRLARIWAKDRIMDTKQAADESYLIASTQDIETAQQYITPQLSGYYRA